MDKGEAVIEIMRDARSQRSSNTSCQRVVRALKLLGLSQEEMIAALSWADYCTDEGNPWSDKYKRTW